MGLDAVVYRKRDNLPFDPDRAGAHFDARTGEYYFHDRNQFGEDALVALHERLGNASNIAFLSEAVARSLGRQDSLLERKVLFSGTHAGDVIEPADFDELRSELAQVQTSPMIRAAPPRGVCDPKGCF